ncbi:MAG: septal ring lytic transglycosylase RlpA family protein [Magnetococcus sp. DMHC-8]
MLGLGLLSACTSVRDGSSLVSIPEPIHPAPPGHAKVGKPYTVSGITYHPRESSEGYLEEGVASWYGKQFHHRRTANGELFDMNTISAAHTTLPLPVHVRVTNLKNDRWAIVRVNDRGPFVNNRLLDLSWAAAQELGFAEQGTVRVRVEDLSAVELSLDAHTGARVSGAAARGSK